jgi:phospholipid/cholesterol/gamma-HCH transport system substrate-binding protein
VKRENEFAVGLVVIAALALVVGGALWLSGAHFGKTEAMYTARFRTVGGLGAGSPVVLRGVRVGRIEAIRLAPGNWVEADIKIYSGVTPPAKPAVIAASASLSGATLPDIGQLTAQASRIATDIGTVAARVQSAFDSQAVMDLRRSIHDFGQVADRLARVTNEQADVIGDVGSNLQHGSEALSRAAIDLKTTLGRVDTATNQGQLATILNNTAATSTDLRSASQDFRQLMAAANRNQESLVRVLQNADTILSRISNRSGTLGLLVADSTLYRETTLTMIQLRQLLSDIQANPRKYFTFSVF